MMLPASLRKKAITTYTVSAVLNMGWCRVAGSLKMRDLLHVGDFHTTGRGQDADNGNQEEEGGVGELTVDNTTGSALSKDLIAERVTVSEIGMPKFIIHLST